MIVAATCSALFAGSTSAYEPRVPHPSGLATRKAEAGAAPPPLLATLVQTHTTERVPLDPRSPPPDRFDRLLADRATGTSGPLDPRLLELVRGLCAQLASPAGGAPSVELVSGFRSPKLNEMLRKKGHHVASHSQHSLGHALDFRLVVPCAHDDPRCAGREGCDGARALALDPRVLERAIRASGWDGGVGTYTSKDDWFVHADVGPHRSWAEGPRVPEHGEPRPTASPREARIGPQR